MAVKISILGEGSRDYGTESYSGHIQLFLERILEDQLGHPVGLQVNSLDPRQMRAHRKQEKMTPLVTRIYMAFQKTVGNGDQALVVVMDDRREDAKPILDKLKKGREQAETEGLYMPTAIGTAIKEIEAWILADDEARPFGLGDTFGRKPLPDAPENIYDPKRLFRELYGQFKAKLQLQGRSDVPNEMDCQAAIIKQIDIAKLKKLCPQGFRPFVEEVRQHILPLFEKNR